MPNRITRERAKGWRKPEGAVIVTRGTIWGNPWAAGTPGLLHTRIDGARVSYRLMVNLNAGDAAFLFEQWLRRTKLGDSYLPDMRQFTDAGKVALPDSLHASRQLILANLHQLRGHDLCCFCKPGQPCHADTLLRLANEE